MQRYLTLLAEHVHLPHDARVLIAELNDAELLGQLAGEYTVSIFQRDYSIAQVMRAALCKRDRVTFADQPLPEVDEQYDAAIVQIPKSRGFAQALLFTCLRALKVGAALYAIGPTHGGVNTALADAGNLGRARLLGNRARHRLFVVERSENLAAPPEWDSPWQPRRVEMRVDNQTCQVMTQPGIFSWDRPDEGTRYLIACFPHVHAKPRRILDAGCGYGLLAMAAQSHFGPADLVLADIDRLATACARDNLPNATVLTHDLTYSSIAGQDSFDLILCNPPFHQGHERNLSFMRAFPLHAKQMMAPGGQLAVVANSFLPYRDLLAPHFGSVIKANDNGRFQVLLAGEHSEL